MSHHLASHYQGVQKPIVLVLYLRHVLFPVYICKLHMPGVMLSYTQIIALIVAVECAFQRWC